jgi:hypothetical protein
MSATYFLFFFEPGFLGFPRTPVSHLVSPAWGLDKAATLGINASSLWTTIELAC